MPGYHRTPAPADRWPAPCMDRRIDQRIFPLSPPGHRSILNAGHRVAVSHLDMVTVADLSSLTKRTIIAAQPTVGCPCISPDRAKLVDRTILQLGDPTHARPHFTNMRGATPPRALLIGVRPTMRDPGHSRGLKHTDEFRCTRSDIFISTAVCITSWTHAHCSCRSASRAAP
jgi:hypothetical protein